MDWQLLSTIMGAAVPIIILDSVVHKLIMENMLNKKLLELTDKYLTRKDFESHLRDCPARKDK